MDEMTREELECVIKPVIEQTMKETIEMVFRFIDQYGLDDARSVINDWMLTHSE